MASQSTNEVEEVVNFLQSRGVRKDIIDAFEKEKMDFEAIAFATDKCLQDIGLEAKGDILALKAFAQRQGNKQSDASYEERKRHLIDELRKGRENRLTPKGKKQKTQNSPSVASTSNKTKTRKITFGWMHWICSPTEKRFVSVRATKGGGTRKVDMPLYSTKDEIVSEGKRLFFPDDVSSHGSAKDMVFDVANFKGEIISGRMTDDGQTVPFTLERYINKHRLVNVRIYLTSKPLGEESSESDDDSWLKFSFLCEVQDLSIQHDEHIEGNENILSSALDSEDIQYQEVNSLSVVENYSSNTVTKLETSIASPAESSLIGTSDERAELLTEQNNAYNQALEEDTRKEKEKADAQENLHRLEVKRAARLSRVPNEPGGGEPRVRVAVQHLTKGKITRNFPQDVKATAIYDWVGSLALEPENFSLCMYPGKAVDLFESVSNVAGTLLHMEVTQNECGDSGTASRDEQIVEVFLSTVKTVGYSTNYKRTKHPRDRNRSYSFVTNCHASVNFSMYEQLPDSPPEILMEDDEWMNSKPGNDQEKTRDEALRSDSNYRSLEEKRKKAADTLHDDNRITIRRDHIVTDLLSAYQDQDITTKRLLVTIENDDAYGSGVAREMYALFWDTFLSQYAEGESEFTIPVLLTLTADDYINLGRILTHQFVQFGAFPVRINQASIQQAIFGHVPDECILSSFLRLLPSREKESLSNAMRGEQPFPVEEVLEVLEDYNIREMPSSNNIRTILLQVAKNELVTKPYMHLLNIRKGMGSFWDDVTKEEVKSLYDISEPTAKRIISCLKCTPKDSKETQTLRWLTRYLKASSDAILSNFLRFCSGTDVVVPGATIALKFSTLPPAAIRPMAKICFRILYLPKHYESFSHMRSNLDVYFSNPSKWDLKDNEVDD